MPLKIQVQRSIQPLPHGSTKVILEGSLDTASAPQLEAELHRVLALPVKVLILDLAKLHFISSSGIRILLAARKRLTEQDSQFLMTNLQPQIAKIFEIIRSLPGVTLFKNETEMDAYLARIQNNFTGGN